LYTPVNYRYVFQAHARMLEVGGVPDEENEEASAAAEEARALLEAGLAHAVAVAEAVAGELLFGFHRDKNQDSNECRSYAEAEEAEFHDALPVARLPATAYLPSSGGVGTAMIGAADPGNVATAFRFVTLSLSSLIRRRRGRAAATPTPAAAAQPHHCRVASCCLPRNARHGRTAPEATTNVSANQWYTRCLKPLLMLRPWDSQAECGR
jgi:hypothetical protein